MKLFIFIVLLTSSLSANIEILTGSKEGSYYSIANDIKKSSNGALGDINVISTNGSLENLHRITKDKEIDFAIVQYDAISYFLNNPSYTEAEKEQVRNLKIVAPLYPEAIHIITKKTLNIRQATDFKNLRVSVGRNNSGTYVSARVIASYTGIRWKKTYKYDSLVIALQAILDNKLDALFYVGGVPVKDLYITKENPNYHIFKDNFEFFTLSSNSPLEKIYPSIKITKEDYPWIDKPLIAPSIKAIIVARDDYTDAESYLKIKKLYTFLNNKLNLLQSGKYSKQWKSVSLKNYKNLSIDIHPAVKNIELEQNKSQNETLEQDNNYGLYIVFLILIVIGVIFFLKFRKSTGVKAVVKRETPPKTMILGSVLVPSDSSLPILDGKKKNDFSIGRGISCDVVIDKEFISSLHVKIKIAFSKVEVVDQGSTNGTYIDGEKLQAQKVYVLKEGQILSIGNEEVSYSIKSDNNKTTNQKITLISQNDKYSNIVNEGVVGRSNDCDTVIKNDNVSRQHLKVEYNNGVFITDLNSANGTYINGKKLEPTQATLLLKNELLVIGSEEVTYKLQ